MQKNGYPRYEITIPQRTRYQRDTGHGPERGIGQEIKRDGGTVSGTISGAGPDSATGHRSGRVTGQSCVRQNRFPPRRPHAGPSFDPDIQHALVSAPQDRRADFHPEFPIRPEFGHHVKQLCREHSHNIGVFTHPARCRAQEQASKQRLYSRPAHTISPRTPSSSSIFTKNRSKSPSAASNRLR